MASIKDKIAAIPYVEDVFDEGLEDGKWAYLSTDYICPDTETSSCHEWSWRDLLRSVRSAVPKEQWEKENESVKEATTTAAIATYPKGAGNAPSNKKLRKRKVKVNNKSNFSDFYTQFLADNYG